MDEKKKFYHSLVFPAFFLFLIWFIRFTEVGMEMSLVRYGVFPQKWYGLIGILTAPLIHADIKHLVDNSVPLFVLSLAIFYFYREIAYRIFFIVYLVSGFLVWIVGREAYHIGASGLIYGFAAFVFFSGVLRKNINLLAISLLVIFLYGSMIWGILPYDYQISWESHLMGAITGTALAVVYRKQGPVREKYSWEKEEENGIPEDPGESENSAGLVDNQDNNQIGN
jgi:membrane associated rhomboid family serine protease